MNQIAVVIALVIAVAGGGYWLVTEANAPEQNTALLGSEFAGEDVDIDTSSVVEMVQGNPDASVEVIEYASFTCPHCARFHANQYQELKANYIDTGLIRFVYREVYFDRFGLWASMVARCGGPLRFNGITTILYDQQSEWLAGGQDPALISQNLRRIGLTAGLGADQLDACMTDAATAQTLVAWEAENRATHNITGTPQFIINGTVYSNMDYDEFAAVLDAALAE